MKAWKINYLKSSKTTNNFMRLLKFRPAFFTRQLDGRSTYHGKCYVAITNKGVFVKARADGPAFQFPIHQCLITYTD
jgi:hypothetical protein